MTYSSRERGLARFGCVLAAILIAMAGAGGRMANAQPVGCPLIGLTPASLPGGIIGVPYMQTLDFTAGTAPFFYSVANLPPGMTPTIPMVGPNVAIGGTPTALFSSVVTVNGVDSNGCGFSQDFSFAVTCPAPPPLVVSAPSIVGAGSPNRTASVADIAGATYAWTITNGTITAGQGTHQIIFTAGAAGTPLDLGVSVTNAFGCPFGGGFAIVTVAPVGEAVLFYTLTPCRLVDTRDPDGSLAGPILAANSTRLFIVTGACSIPPGATAIAVNVSAVDATASGQLVLFAGDAPPPGTSNVSFGPGRTRAGNAIVSLASDGSGGIRVMDGSSGPVHLVLDVSGFFE